MIARVRGFGWGVADQALSSATNFALGIAVARLSTASEFGAFSLVFATYTMALGASRALTTEPLAIRYSAVEAETWRRGTTRATGVAALAGLVGGLVCAMVGVLSGDALRGAMVALGLCLPGLLLQDSWRAAFFAGKSGSLAFFNDLIWAILLLAAVPLVVLTKERSVGTLILAWGLAGGVAGLSGIAQSRAVPKPGDVIRWWREQKDLAPRLLAMFAARNASSQITTYGVAAFSGLAAAGALRGALLLLGPLNVLFAGVNLVSVPRGVQLWKESGERLRLGMRFVAIGLATVSVTWGLLVYLLPDRIGRAALGVSWGPSHSVILPLSIMMAAGGAQLGAVAGVLSMGHTRVAMVTQIVEGSLTVTGGLVGALVGGARGAAWGLALAYVLEAIMWWLQFDRLVRRTDRPSVATETFVSQPSPGPAPHPRV